MRIYLIRVLELKAREGEDYKVLEIQHSRASKEER